jgi:hypothetical protein
MSEVRMLKVAVLVTADTRPKELSELLEFAFYGVDEVLQFAVEGHGWDENEDPTEESLLAALVDGEVDRRWPFADAENAFGP